MGSEDKKEDRRECMQRCEEAYIKRIRRTRAGGVENLRKCRESCPQSENG